MTITAEQLAAATGCRVERAAKWLPHILTAMQAFQIDTPARQAAFLAQIGHESSRLSILEENLNYSADALSRVFKKYFTPAQAIQYARKPVQIASRVYGGRMGNGDEASKDGYKYRGRGLIQITGKDNYRECGAALGEALLTDPDLLLTPRLAALSAGWFWSTHGCNELSDAGDFVGVTKRINGGTNGFDERLALFTSGKAALGIA